MEKPTLHRPDGGCNASRGLWCRVEIPGDMKRLEEVEETILSQCQRHSFTERDLFALKLAIEEAYANAVKHGNRCDCDKHVRIKYRVTSRRADVVVEDEGHGFNPASLPDPTRDEHLESAHGRGILLMRAFMNNVVFNPTGNAVTLTKFNDSPRNNVESSLAFG